jgi:hypothetical protein
MRLLLLYEKKGQQKDNNKDGNLIAKEEKVWIYV